MRLRSLDHGQPQHLAIPSDAPSLGVRDVASHGFDVFSGKMRVLINGKDNEIR